jgi:hypothetical protein
MIRHTAIPQRNSGWTMFVSLPTFALAEAPPG